MNSTNISPLDALLGKMIVDETFRKIYCDMISPDQFPDKDSQLIASVLKMGDFDSVELFEKYGKSIIVKCLDCIMAQKVLNEIT